MQTLNEINVNNEIVIRDVISQKEIEKANGITGDNDFLYLKIYIYNKLYFNN